METKIPSLSNRGDRYKTFEDLMTEYIDKYFANKYDKETNPEGIINLGTSENKLISDIVLPKLNQGLEIKEEHLHYYVWPGTQRFRRIIADFLERYLKPVEKINSDHIVAFNGCSSAIRCLGSAICDPGEGILIPGPYYPGFDTDLSLDPEIVCFPVNLRGKPVSGNKMSFELTVEDLELSLRKAKEQNVTIRALLLCNPQNPFGIVYSENQVREYMSFAQRHSLHLISDEIYLLSIFKGGCSMVSALAVNGLIDPDLLHVVWGYGKDFGMSGIRAGVVYSRNPDILAALKTIVPFHAIPSFLQDVLGNFINDHEWLDNVLIPTSHKRLRQCHEVLSEALQRIDVPFVDGCAGLFVWVDLRQFINPLDFEKEKSLLNILLDHGVYITPGFTFHSVEPGWFRIIFASDLAIVKLGIERLVSVLENMKNNEKNKS